MVGGGWKPATSPAAGGTWRGDSRSSRPPSRRPHPKWCRRASPLPRATTNSPRTRTSASRRCPKPQGGAGGFTYTLTPAPPKGLSFDPASRTLTGTPSEAGQHSLQYSATDADGTQVGLSFQITIVATAAQGRSANGLSGTKITLTVSPASFAENDLAAKIKVTATRNTDVAQHTITLSLSGTATKGTDYTVSPSPLPVLQIRSGFVSASATLTFVGMPDAAIEGDKTITISGTAPGGPSAMPRSPSETPLRHQARRW